MKNVGIELMMADDLGFKKMGWLGCVCKYCNWPTVYPLIDKMIWNMSLSPTIF